MRAYVHGAILFSVVGFFFSFISYGGAQSDDCGVAGSLRQTDMEWDAKKKKNVPHIRTVLHDERFVVFSEKMHINTDGNLRSYSKVDPDGTLCSRLPPDADPVKSGCAMNTICYGLNIYRNGNKIEDCGDKLTAFDLLKRSDWKVSGLKIDFFAIESKGGIPCESPEGFLISATSTKSNLQTGACDQRRYLDSAVPSIVVPKCWNESYRRKNVQECKVAIPGSEVLDIRPRDLAVVRTRQGGKIIFAIVGDHGPNNKLGEVSVGLHMLAKDKKVLPRTRKETNSYAYYEIFDVVVFRGSRIEDVLTPEDYSPMTNAAKVKFETAWASNADLAVKRLTRCGLKARPN